MSQILQQLDFPQDAPGINLAVKGSCNFLHSIAFVCAHIFSEAAQGNQILSAQPSMVW